MLYLRRGDSESTFEIWSLNGTPYANDKRLTFSVTELQVRRFFRDRAIAAARIAVTQLLADVKPRSS